MRRCALAKSYAHRQDLMLQDRGGVQRLRLTPQRVCGWGRLAFMSRISPKAGRCYRTEALRVSENGVCRKPGFREWKLSEAR